MRPESWFEELTKSLSDGFFADEVILALAKAEHTGHVEGSDQTVMQEVVRFLERVSKGYCWLDNPTVNDETATNASFFQQAVRASAPAGTMESFPQQIEQLKKTADALAKAEHAELNDVEALRCFFVRHSTSEMERTETLFDNRVGLGTSAWMTAHG
jgi:hypothetical protein